MELCAILFHLKDFFSHPLSTTLIGVAIGYSLSIERDIRKSRNIKKIIFTEISSVKKSYSSALIYLIDEYKNRQRLRYTSPKHYDVEYVKSLMHEYVLNGHYVPSGFRQLISDFQGYCETVRMFSEQRDKLIAEQNTGSIIIPSSETGSMIVHCTLLIYGLHKMEKHKFKTEFDKEENWVFCSKIVADELNVPLDDNLIEELRRISTIELE